MAIDHVSIPVRDLAASARFYEAVLAPLGYAKLREASGTVGFGKKFAEFWLNHRPAMRPDPDSGTHICLRARDTSMVDAFHAAAVRAGGASDGAPGPRPSYSPNYYAAFIEAVTFLPGT
jgi:catechol 2,3-dioxygenase-like lactoylglutathione lyase family enzyme